MQALRDWGFDGEEVQKLHREGAIQ